jgi:type I restriction enzyme R subunit
VETRFTTSLDPEPCSRNVFSFHRPETMGQWLDQDTPPAQEEAAESQPPFGKPSTLNLRLKKMPELIEDGLWPAQMVFLIRTLLWNTDMRRLWLMV